MTEGSEFINGQWYHYETKLVDTDYGPERMLKLTNERTLETVTVQECGTISFCVHLAIGMMNQ